METVKADMAIEANIKTLYNTDKDVSQDADGNKGAYNSSREDHIAEINMKKKLYNKIYEYRKRNHVSVINPLRFAQHLGVTVLTTNLEEFEGLLGFYYIGENGQDYIYVNKNEDLSMMREIIAHEIGHYLLVEDRKKGAIYDKYTWGSDRQLPREKVCDFFAREMLMPESEFSKAYYDSLDRKDPVAYLAELFGVRKDLVRERIKELCLEQPIEGGNTFV